MKTGLVAKMNCSLFLKIKRNKSLKIWKVAFATNKKLMNFCENFENPDPVT